MSKTRQILCLVISLLVHSMLLNSANAKSEVFGSLHVFAGQVAGVSGINLNAYSTSLGFKGTSSLNKLNGNLNKNWVLSHRVEIELNTFNDALEGGGVRKFPSGVRIKNDKNSRLEFRNAWLGVKTPSGEFRVGRHPSIYDIVDNGQNLLTKVGQALPSSRETTDQLLYVNKSGLMAYSLSFAPFESNAKERVLSGLINYANGSYYVGLGLEKSSGLSLGSKLSVGYNHDDQYELGLTYDRQLGSSATSLTVAGLYRFGKVYLGAELGEVLSGDVLNQDNSIKFTENTQNRALEIGYQWNKDTRFYIDYSSLGERKETTIAVKYEY